MFAFLELETIFLITHVFGAILGAGGAFTSDAMFMSSAKDGRITQTEMRFMRLGGRLIWTGLTILIVSGLCLFALQPEEYLTSDKFLAKMSIVGIIAINGFIFHASHLPLLKKNLGVHFASSPAILKRSSLLLISGSISMISWISAVVLGMIKNLPWEYGLIMGIYISALIFGALTAVLLKRKLLHLS
ncbi:MAG: hypothetical protein AAB787_00575 [Patescibacteria group bacterium]